MGIFGCGTPSEELHRCTIKDQYFINQAGTNSVIELFIDAFLEMQEEAMADFQQQELSLEFQAMIQGIPLRYSVGQEGDTQAGVTLNGVAYTHDALLSNNDLIDLSDNPDFLQRLVTAFQLIGNSSTPVDTFNSALGWTIAGTIDNRLYIDFKTDTARLAEIARRLYPAPFGTEVIMVT